MLNKHKRLFHSSRVKFRLVSMSVSCFSVSMYLIWVFARVGNDAKRVQSALCTRMRIVFSLGSDLSSRRLCKERCVTVMSTVSGCDVITVQQHYKGSPSTPPRVARLCDSRSVPRCTEKNINKKMLTCVDHSTRPIHHIRIQRFLLTVEIIRRHCTICLVNASRSTQYPCQALISICGISRVPELSFRCHSD